MRERGHRGVYGGRRGPADPCGCNCLLQEGATTFATTWQQPLFVHRKIGEGSFGEVVLATFRGTKVGAGHCNHSGLLTTKILRCGLCPNPEWPGRVGIMGRSGEIHGEFNIELTVETRGACISTAPPHHAPPPPHS